MKQSSVRTFTGVLYAATACSPSIAVSDRKSTLFESDDLFLLMLEIRTVPCMGGHHAILRPIAWISTLDVEY